MQRTLTSLLVVLLTTAPAVADRFGLIRSFTAVTDPTVCFGSGIAVIGALGDLLLIAGRKRGVDATDPVTGVVQRTFVPPAGIDASCFGFGGAAVIGGEVFLGAPVYGGGGAVVVYDAGTAAFERVLGIQQSDFADFGRFVWASNGRLVVGLTQIDDQTITPLWMFVDPTTGSDPVIQPTSPGDVAFADDAGIFLRDPAGVRQLDDDGNAVRTLVSPEFAAADGFGSEGISVTGSDVLVGAPSGGADHAGRVYRFDRTSGAVTGTIEAPAGTTHFGRANIVPWGSLLAVGSVSQTTSVETVSLVDAVTGALRGTLDPGQPVDFGPKIVAAGATLAVGTPSSRPYLIQNRIQVFADLANCGNATVDAGEACDDGNTTDGDGCDSNCQPTGCGNGVRTDGEECDDGNVADGDWCSATCAVAAVCGDGIVGPSEQCDDGNLISGDGCEGDCTLPTCGNHIVDAGEQCDDGNLIDDDFCNHDCTLARCGDGIRSPRELCDDGNTVDGDGCPSTCGITTCGNGVTEPPEECDDLDHVDGDACSPLCSTHPTGPYGFGTTRVVYTYFSQPLGMLRHLDTVVWYPTDTPRPAVVGVPDVDPSTNDLAVARGRFPLIVASHGFGGGTPYSLFIPFFLARNGFIVAQPFHEHDDALPFIDANGLVGGSLIVRRHDMSVLLDRLLDDATVPPVLRGHIDADRIGAIGQSAGGVTATAVALDGVFGGIPRDPRFKAVVGASAEDYIFQIPQMAGSLRTSRVPIMLILGDRDTFFTVTGEPRAVIDGIYDELPAPRILVELLEGEHADSFGNFDTNPFTQRLGGLLYPLAFFDVYLRNGTEGVSRLHAPGPEFGQVAYRADPGPQLVPGGSGRHDCMLELAPGGPDTLGADAPDALSCIDGAPCDADPRPGYCGFDVSVCVNVVDRHLPRCTPSDVQAVQVAKATGDAELAALQATAAVIAPTSDRRCSAPTRLTVRIPASHDHARRAVRIRAVDGHGIIDHDRYLFRCSAR